MRVLSAWREKETRCRNLPRYFVIREATLPHLARQRLTSLKIWRDVGASLSGADEVCSPFPAGDEPCYGFNGPPEPPPVVWPADSRVGARWLEC